MAAKRTAKKAAMKKAHAKPAQLALGLEGALPEPPAPPVEPFTPPAGTKRAKAHRFRTPKILPWSADRIRERFMGIADRHLVELFIEYHRANEDVYKDFIDRAFRALRTGRIKYSQWTIIQAIRWDRDMKTYGDVFKINNDYIALYVRMAIVDYPLKLINFFETRKMKPSGRKMSREQVDREIERDAESAGVVH
jgi:hypothetical protein